MVVVLETDIIAEKYPVLQRLTFRKWPGTRLGWAQKQQNANCNCLYKDTAKLLLCFPKASITIFSVDVVQFYVFRGVTIRTCGRCENYVPISPSGTCKVMLLQKCCGVIG